MGKMRHERCAAWTEAHAAAELCGVVRGEVRDGERRDGEERGVARIDVATGGGGGNVFDASAAAFPFRALFAAAFDFVFFATRLLLRDVAAAVARRFDIFAVFAADDAIATAACAALIAARVFFFAARSVAATSTACPLSSATLSVASADACAAASAAISAALIFVLRACIFAARSAVAAATARARSAASSCAASSAASAAACAAACAALILALRARILAARIVAFRFRSFSFASSRAFSCTTSASRALLRRRRTTAERMTSALCRKAVLPRSAFEARWRSATRRHTKSSRTALCIFTAAECVERCICDTRHVGSKLRTHFWMRHAT